MRHITLLAITVPVVLSLTAVACGDAVQEQSTGSATGTGGAGGTTTDATVSGTGGTTTTASMMTSSVVTTGTTTATTTTTSSTSGGFCQNIGAPSTTYPAKHPANPTLLNYGGPTLAAPNFIPVFFKNDDPMFTAQLDDFIGKVGTTSYWTATTSEYGVGPATKSPAVQLTENAPNSTNATGIENWLTDKILNDPTFPKPGTDTLYILNYPASTSISLGMGSQTCVDVGGYHENLVNVNGKDVAFAVIPRCSFGMSVIDTTTGSMSHELIEAATDPYPYSNPAYQSVDVNHIIYQFALGGAENGDLCAQNQDSPFGDYAGIGYSVQRTWSNKALQGGHDPCVPQNPATPLYAALVPVLPDKIDVGGGQTTKSVHIPQGQSKTIEVDAFTDGDTGPFQVQAIDPGIFGGQLDLALDCDHAENGQKLHLTITVNQASQQGAEVFFLVTIVNNTPRFWLGLVDN